jgi:hypothetical protein
MEALIRARPYALATFLCALAVAFASPFLDSTWLLRVAGSIAHIALCAFLATESFGRIADSRSPPSRWAARAFFALSVPVACVAAESLLLGPYTQ